MSNGNDLLPDSIRGLAPEVQIAVLYERVKNLGDDVQQLKRALWATVGSVAAGAILFLFSIAAGWLPHGTTAHALAAHALAAIGRFL